MSFDTEPLLKQCKMKIKIKDTFLYVAALAQDCAATAPTCADAEQRYTAATEVLSVCKRRAYCRLDRALQVWVPAQASSHCVHTVVNVCRGGLVKLSWLAIPMQIAVHQLKKSCILIRV